MRATLIALTSTVENHVYLIMACYEQAPPETEVTDFTMKFVVQRSGTVRLVTISPLELGRSNFGKCVALRYREVPFGRHTEERSFRIPINLTRLLETQGRK